MAGRKRFSTLPRAIWSPDIIARHHLDSFRRGKRGQVTQVHHIRFGWMSAKRYYELQKTHEAEAYLMETVKAGYALNSTIYGFGTEVKVAGFEIPIPAGMGLLGAAMADIATQLAAQPPDPLLLAKALYKIFGP
mgnify:FL=1